MRKLLLIAVMTIGMVASSVAQMAIPGAIFTTNQSRFNGRKVTIKNVQVLPESISTNQMAVTPLTTNGGAVSIPTPTAPVVGPQGSVGIVCNPPRGYKEVNILFLEEPEFKSCFFVADVMYRELMKQTGGQATDAQITFRGDSRIGYHITFFKLGM